MDDPALSYLNGLGYSVWTSRGAGLVLGVDSALLLLPLCRDLLRYVRNTPLNKIMPFDESIFFHRMVAFTILLFSLVHTNAHYVNFFTVWIGDLAFGTTFYDIHYFSWAGVTGHLMWFIMVVMFSAAHEKVRHQSFETFWYLHHLAFAWYFCFFFHAYGCFVKTDPFWLSGGDPAETSWECRPYNSWMYNLVGFSIYVLERVVRMVRSRMETNVTKVVMHPANTLEIQFMKPSMMNYKPGQYIFVNVPQVSRFQWHPFTLTSAPEEKHISIHMRLVGDWTKAVASAYGATQRGDKPTLGGHMPALRVDGAFGAPAEDVFRCEMVVMIGAGIGVTPFASILKSVFYRTEADQALPLKKVHFFWVNRDKEAFEWFQEELSALEERLNSDLLSMHFYLTTAMKEAEIHNIVVNDVGSEFDPVTELRSRTHYGRPNFDLIFRGVREDAITRFPNTQSVRVGIFFCGPSVLAKNLKRTCLKHTTNRVEFHFLKEHF